VAEAAALAHQADITPGSKGELRGKRGIKAGMQVDQTKGVRAYYLNICLIGDGGNLVLEFSPSFILNLPEPGGNENNPLYPFLDALLQD